MNDATFVEPAGRVLWLTSSYPHEGNPVTGIFYRTQAVALSRRGLRVDVVAPSPFVPPCLGRLSARWEALGRVPRDYERDGLRIRRPRFLALPRMNRGLPGDLSVLAAVRGLGLPAPTLLHAHTAFPIGSVALQAALDWRVPYVLTLHGSDVNVIPQVNGYYRRRFVAAVRGAAAVLAVSSALAEVTEGVAGRRPVVAPIGVDLQRTRELPDRAGARRQLDLPPGAFVVLYVGNLHEAKGVDQLCRVLAERSRSDTLGVLVGDGPLLARARSVPGVRAPGPVPNERVPLYLRAADVLVLPSRSEGLPTVLVEAGSVGTPIIATTVGGCPELLADGRGLLIPPGDDRALVEALAAVRGDPGGAASRARSLHAHVRDRYDVDVNAAALQALYADVLSRHRGVRASSTSTTRSAAWPSP